MNSTQTLYVTTLEIKNEELNRKLTESVKLYEALAKHSRKNLLQLDNTNDNLNKTHKLNEKLNRELTESKKLYEDLKSYVFARNTDINLNKHT